MQAEPGFYAPLQYSPAWVWAGVALLAVVAGWYVFVFAATRHRRTAAHSPRPASLTDLPALKAAYLQRIDDVERAAAAGRRGVRASHQDISRLLRSFVRDASGVDALRMTRQDLERHPLPAAASAVGVLYRGEFGQEPLPPVSTAAAKARETVSAWG